MQVDSPINRFFLAVEFPIKQKKQQHMTSVFTYKFFQPMVSYGTGVTQGPRMLGGFFVQKCVIFMTKST